MFKRKVIGKNSEPVAIAYEDQIAKIERGAINVLIQDQYTDSVDLYLHEETATPSLTFNVDVDDVIINIDDDTGIVAGHAVTIYENNNFFQSIVKTVATNTITVYTLCDKEFTTNAIVKTGAWKMNVNGSVTERVFSILAPPLGEMDVYGITISGLSDLSMDGTTFLGIENGITNGFLIRHTNGTHKNLGLFFNNLGVEEFGYTASYIPSNKKSQYGILANKNFHEQNGVSVRLCGCDGDKFEAIVRDDLSSEVLLAIIIHGHLIEE